MIEEEKMVLISLGLSVFKKFEERGWERLDEDKFRVRVVITLL